MFAELRQWYTLRHLLINFVRRDLRLRYVGSAMGLFWSVLNPLIMLVVFTYVFSAILKIKFGDDPSTRHFALYLFCGMLPWMTFQETTLRSTNSMVENAGLIKRVSFPPQIVPVYLWISSFTAQLVGLAILSLATLYLVRSLSPVILFLPVLVLLQFFFTIGLSWFLAALNVFFRDTLQIMSALLMLWMYLTPIFYPSSIVPEEFRFLLSINPIAHLVQAYRDLFLNQKLPAFSSMLILAVISLVVFVLGSRFFRHFAPRFPDLV